MCGMVSEEAAQFKRGTDYEFWRNRLIMMDCGLFGRERRAI